MFSEKCNLYLKEEQRYFSPTMLSDATSGAKTPFYFISFCDVLVWDPGPVCQCVSTCDNWCCRDLAWSVSYIGIKVHAEIPHVVCRVVELTRATTTESGP